MSFQLPLFLPFLPTSLRQVTPAPQSPLPVIHRHLLPASDFPSSSSVHHCPPPSQPPFPQLHANLPQGSGHWDLVPNKG